MTEIKWHCPCVFPDIGDIKESASEHHSRKTQPKAALPGNSANARYRR